MREGVRVSVVLRVCVLVLVACSSSESSFRVDLRTDYAPGLEVVTAHTNIWRDATRSRLVHEETRPIPAGPAAFDGLRIAEANVPRGSIAVEVELLDGNGVRVASRFLTVQVRGDTGVTALLTRNCAGVACPTSDVTATECLGGRCVDPECSPETPERCPDPMCTDATGCPTGAACADAECVTGVCVLRPNDSRCEAGEACDPEDGCEAPPTDAGTDAGQLDAGLDAPIDADDDDADDMDASDDASGDSSVDCGECPGTCSSFGVCEIDDPVGPVTCPPDVPCEITCSNPTSCTGMVDCGSASECRVHCNSTNSCPVLTCGRGDCRFQCEGTNSCASVTCTSPDGCNIECSGTAACADVTCSGGECEIDCGATACAGGVDCASACQCDVDCEGDACTPAATCSPGCQDGTECSESLLTCDMCD